MSGFDNFGWERLREFHIGERSHKDAILETVEASRRTISVREFNAIVEAVKEGWADYATDEDEDE